MKKHNKLVRDNVPNIIKENGDSCNFHIATNEEYEEKLYEKINEELFEFIGNPCAEEIADILEVVECIARFHNINLEDIKQYKIDKKRTNGGFHNKIILESTE